MSAILRTFVLRNEPNANALWQFLKNNWRALAGAGKPLAVTVQQHKGTAYAARSRKAKCL